MIFKISPKFFVINLGIVSIARCHCRHSSKVRHVCERASELKNRGIIHVSSGTCQLSVNNVAKAYGTHLPEFSGFHPDSIQSNSIQFNLIQSLVQLVVEICSERFAVKREIGN